MTVSRNHRSELGRDGAPPASAAFTCPRVVSAPFPPEESFRTSSLVFTPVFPKPLYSGALGASQGAVQGSSP